MDQRRIVRQKTGSLPITDEKREFNLLEGPNFVEFIILIYVKIHWTKKNQQRKHKQFKFEAKQRKNQRKNNKHLFR